jgi:N-acetylglutamate synthase/N-acetylornithine aminotransferase
MIMSDQLPPGNLNVFEPVFEDGAPRCESTCAHHFDAMCVDGDTSDGCRVMDYQVQYSCLCEPAAKRMAQAIRDIEAILTKLAKVMSRDTAGGAHEYAVDKIQKVMAKLKSEVRYT